MLKTHIYKIVIEKDGGRFHAYCPALKGCHTWGKTEREAALFAQEAVSAYIEDLIKAGEPLPVYDVDLIDRPVASVTV
ncbi:type II toxin-antitoxin system HicB family antitoxin [Candidatus Berkelbacteria bacterium]|nr:type II toxin-antitoxin system HicB family antitoxin [Candidatus Berkelbacteria bacterium]